MMGKGIMNMVKGDKGDKGDGGDSMVSSRTGDPNSDYWHPDDGVIRGYRSFKNFSYTNNYSNAKFDETLEGEPQTPVVEQSKTNKLTEIASSFGSNIMSDIK